MTVKIKKWGNSLGLRLPKKVAEAQHLLDGSEVDIIETSEGILLKKRTTISMKAILAAFPEDYEPTEELIPDTLKSEEW